MVLYSFYFISYIYFFNITLTNLTMGILLEAPTQVTFFLFRRSWEQGKLQYAFDCLKHSYFHNYTKTILITVPIAKDCRPERSKLGVIISHVRPDVPRKLYIRKFHTILWRQLANILWSEYSTQYSTSDIYLHCMCTPD